jgi:two-component SAPR family response regulator
MKNGKPIIAIVNDDIDISSLLVDIFQMRNIPVCFVANDIQEALSKFKSANPKPDIVMMGFGFLYYCGVDLAKKILAVQPSVKIIFLGLDMDLMEDAYEAGVSLFLVMPVRMNIFTDAINIVHNNTGKYKYDGNQFRNLKSNTIYFTHQIRTEKPIVHTRPRRGAAPQQ